ncbi:MAG: hypothetical protein CML24_00535 [Rhizobiales bacterium]|nr:hypothetical protein [Hyphomicrobiales bacterium]|tara:strand:+ start:407 stop:625 length:219 start_codon:yes stop_codon:yes gene_type:complete
MEDDIRAVLDEPGYRDLFADAANEEILNQRLAANAVGATIVSILRHPFGGFIIEYATPAGDGGTFIHPGWDD